MWCIRIDWTHYFGLTIPIKCQPFYVICITIYKCTFICSQFCTFCFIFNTHSGSLSVWILAEMNWHQYHNELYPFSIIWKSWKSKRIRFVWSKRATLKVIICQLFSSSFFFLIQIVCIPIWTLKIEEDFDRLNWLR